MRGLGDLAGHFNRLDGRVFNVIVPGFGPQGGIRIAPTHHEGAVALRHQMPNHRVIRLQIEYVKLVDARGHQQKWFFKHFGSQGLVFNELKQLILKHHGTFSGSHIAAHFKLAFVGHRYMALLHIMQQVLQTLGNAFALGVNGFLLGIDIEGQEIAGS